MTIRRWSFLLVLVAVVASADQGPPVYQSVTTAPLAGTVCDGNRVQVETATGTIWTCVASVWTKTYDPQARILLQQPNEAFPYALNVSGLGEGLLLNEPYYGIVGVKLANTCTNQFPRYDNTSGVWTCQSIATSDLPGVPVSKGGTGIYTTTAGAVMSGAATNTMVWSAAGTNTLQVLHSGIAGVPTWGYVNVNSIETSNVASAGNFLRGDGSWAAATGSGAPTDATYIVQTPNAGLSAEQATNALASGIVRVTIGTGVLSSTTTVGANEITGTLTQAVGGTGAVALTCAAGERLTSNGTAYSCSAIPVYAPTGATYIVQQPDATLSAEQATNALASGIVRVTTATGVLTSTTTVGSNEITGIIPAANGGTNNGYFAISGPTTSTKTWTVPDASLTVPTPVAGAVMYSSSTTAFAQTDNPATGAILTGTAGGKPAWLADAAVGSVLVTGGVNTIPAWLAVQSCNTSGGASATCTITVRSGCKPVCSQGGSGASAYLIKAVVSTTTLTCTFSTSATTHICNCLCP